MITIQSFTIETLSIDKCERTLWRFSVSIDEDIGASIHAKLTDFERHSRPVKNDSWTLVRWWAPAGRKIGSRSKRVERPRVDEGIKALVVQMIAKGIKWR